VVAINEDVQLQDRARERVNQLNAYESRHPGQGPDADGKPYDPVNDVIFSWLGDESANFDFEVDEIRTATIKSRIWEGFAWANHRFVLSDERGNALIVGYNEDARVWFVDTTTPVRLPVEWVADFVAEIDVGRTMTGLENPREVHEAIVHTVGGTTPTIPSLNEVAEYLRSRREQQ
jgi:hypothetical protein